MRDFREQNFYELLEVKPHVSQADLERSYQRLKRFFGSRSVATYALFQPDELVLLRRRIEDAYRILSDPERRQRYNSELERLDGKVELVGTAAADSAVDEVEAEAQPASIGESHYTLHEAGNVFRRLTDEARQNIERKAGTREGRGEAEDLAAGVFDNLANKDGVPGNDLETDVIDQTIPVESEEVATPEAEQTAAAESDLEPVVELPAEADTEAGDDLELLESDESGPDELEVLGEEDLSDQVGEKVDAEEKPILPPMPEINEQTIYNGELLRQAREAKGFSLEKLADKTKISIYFLRNLENEVFDDLPALVYVRGYLKFIAQLLGLDQEATVKGITERISQASNK